MSRFLIVDDSPSIRLVLKQAIKHGRAGVEVLEAADAGQAVSEFRIHKPDVVFLDMMLGQGSGNDVLRLILSEDPGTKIVLVTGLPKEHPHVVEAISWGAFAHVQKPVRVDAVKKIIAELEQESGRAGRVR